MKILRIILLTINIIAALGLLTTTLAGTIAPSRSILPSVLAYGYLPMLLVNIVLVLLWLLMGRWEFLVSTAAIALRYSFIGLFFQIGGTADIPSADKHPSMLTLMTYNLHNFSGTGVKLSSNDSIALEFLDFIREYHPDVLCLQEYEPKVKKIHVTDSLELMGYNFFHGARGTVDNPDGTVVFSKIPITAAKQIDNQKLYVDLHLDGRPFRILCVHMDSYAFNPSDRADIEQMKYGHLEDSTSRRTFSKARETILAHEREWNSQLHPLISESPLPLILAGDMNDIPSSWLYSQVTNLLYDTYRDKGLGFCTTFNGGFPRFRIDMVFRSSDFTTLSYRRIKTPLSDHYPVLVALELKN
jgi:endonuclease/exonuclease/phosphatase family metal-dependent hydrolase